jgi:hypothetical protein
MILWDHIFAGGSGDDHEQADDAGGDAPLVLMLACLSILLGESSSLRTMTCSDDVVLWSSQPHGGLDIRGVVGRLAALKAHTPTVELFRATTLEISAEDQAGAGGSAGDAPKGVGSPPWPLPASGAYPPLRGFPRFAMDFQLAQRSRLEAAHQAALAKQKLVDELAERSRELSLTERRWAEQRKQLEGPLRESMDCLQVEPRSKAQGIDLVRTLGNCTDADSSHEMRGVVQEAFAADMTGRAGKQAQKEMSSVVRREGGLVADNCWSRDGATEKARAHEEVMLGELSAARSRTQSKAVELEALLSTHSPDASLPSAFETTR